MLEVGRQGRSDTREGKEGAEGIGVIDIIWFPTCFGVSVCLYVFSCFLVPPLSLCHVPFAVRLIYVFNSMHWRRRRWWFQRCESRLNGFVILVVASPMILQVHLQIYIHAQRARIDIDWFALVLSALSPVPYCFRADIYCLTSCHLSNCPGTARYRECMDQ